MARALTLPPHTRLALLILAASALGRLVIATWMPLGLDEAYAIAVAREFSLSFFDHPPLGFWLPVAMAAFTGIEAPLVYRLPFVVLGTVTGIALWRTGCLLGGPAAGLATLGLYAVAPFMVLGGGVMVVPDGPLNAAGAVFAWMVLRQVTAGPAAPSIGWVMAGLALGVAAVSKYHAVFMAAGLAAYVLISPQARAAWTGSLRGWWHLGVVALLGLLGALPALVWNLGAGGASVAFHAGRMDTGLAPLNLIAMTAIQAAYLLPPVFVLALAGLGRALRAGDGPARLLLWLSLLPIVAFSAVFLQDTQTFAHWTMPGWLFALPLAGWWMTAGGEARHRRARAWVAGFAAPVWAVAALALVHLNTGAVTGWLERTPAWDDTSGLMRWDSLGPRLADGGWFDGVEMIATRDWIDGGLMGTGLAGAPQAPRALRVLGPDPRHFGHMRAAQSQAPALLLVPGPLRHGAARLAEAEALAKKAGASILRAEVLEVNRGPRPHGAVAALRIAWE